jgi:hypothetical protein
MTGRTNIGLHVTLIIEWHCFEDYLAPNALRVLVEIGDGKWPHKARHNTRDIDFSAQSCMISTHYIVCTARGRPLNTVGLASQICHENDDEDCPDRARLIPLPHLMPMPAPHGDRSAAGGIEDATLTAQVREVLARFDALDVGASEVVLVHGDLGSQNLAFAPETSEVLGLYDFEDMACVDRHWDFKYVHSYPAAFRRAVLEAYQDGTGLVLDVGRIALYHALAALSFLAWRVEDPEAHDRLSGRDEAGAYRWVRQAIAWALA